MAPQGRDCHRQSFRAVAGRRREHTSNSGELRAMAMAHVMIKAIQEKAGEAKNEAVQRGGALASYRYLDLAAGAPRRMHIVNWDLRQTLRKLSSSWI